MSAALSFLAPLVAASLSSSGPVESEASLDRASMRFADVLVTSYSCELLGFDVDYQGLAEWGEETRARLVAAGADPGDALSRMQDDIGAQRDSFHRYQGKVIRQVVARRGLANIDLGHDAIYRYQKTFTDRCEDLAASSDAGAFFVAPDERLSGAGLGRKILHMARLSL